VPLPTLGATDAVLAAVTGGVHTWAVVDGAGAGAGAGLGAGAGEGAGAGAGAGAGEGAGLGAGAAPGAGAADAPMAWHCLLTPGKGSLPKKALVHGALPVTVFVIHALLAP
jgi:hypothetical protein